MPIEQDDFDAWRAIPITEKLLEMLRAEADTARETWMLHSWQGGGTDPAVLYEMKGRASICEMIIGMTAEDLDDTE